MQIDISIILLAWATVICAFAQEGNFEGMVVFWALLAAMCMYFLKHLALFLLGPLYALAGKKIKTPQMAFNVVCFCVCLFFKFFCVLVLFDCMLLSALLIMIVCWCE
jgi:hypothetical protein